MSEPADSTSVPSPLDVARLLWAQGAIYEAASMLRAVCARDPEDTRAAEALRAVRAGEEGPEMPPIRLRLSLADAWLRRGWALESLALLVGSELWEQGTGAEWAERLTELLLPLPAGAGPSLEAVYHQLLLGRGPEALASLEAEAARGALPSWAHRRLTLMRWAFPDPPAQRAPQRAALAQHSRDQHPRDQHPRDQHPSFTASATEDEDDTRVSLLGKVPSEVMALTGFESGEVTFQNKIDASLVAASRPESEEEATRIAAIDPDILAALQDEAPEAPEAPRVHTFGEASPTAPDGLLRSDYLEGHAPKAQGPDTQPTARPEARDDDLLLPAEKVQRLLQAGALQEALAYLEELATLQPSKRRWTEWAHSVRAQIYAAERQAAAQAAPKVEPRPTRERIRAVGAPSSEEGQGAAVVVSRRIVKVSD